MSLVVLDRDGVINVDRSDHVRSLADWQVIDGSLEAIAQLTRVGFHCVVATNQSGVGRGYTSAQTLEDIHNHLHAQVRAAGGVLAAIHVCPHHPDDGCDCRKPKPGLLNDIRAAYPKERRIPFVGDSRGDVDAAMAASMDPVLVRTGKGEATQAALTPALRARTRVYSSLSAAIPDIIKNYL